MLRLNLARPIAALAIGASILVGACGGGSASPAASGSGPDADALEVVTTTTVLADLVGQVGGARVDVVSLVPKGGEVHTFDPTPADVQRVTDAQLIVMNGLGLDKWLADLVTDAGTSAPLLKLAEDLQGVELLTGDGEPGEEFNPHLWLNVAYASKYVDRIQEALTAAAPADAATFASGADAYRTRLAELDAFAKSELAKVPASDRKVVAFHEAFPYFAAAYGLEIVGTIVSAPGQDPSAGELADLVAAIRDNGVKAIFAEAQFSDDLVQTLADETGASVVANLYNDSVGDAPADTYEGMMRWNIARVMEALAAG